MLKSELQSTKQSQKLQFKDGYLSKDDQDEVVNSNMEIIRRDGWILDVQRLDGTKASVHVPERKVNSEYVMTLVFINSQLSSGFVGISDLLCAS